MTMLQLQPGIAQDYVGDSLWLAPPPLSVSFVLPFCIAFAFLAAVRFAALWRGGSPLFSRIGNMVAGMGLVLSWLVAVVVQEGEFWNYLPRETGLYVLMQAVLAGLVGGLLLELLTARPALTRLCVILAGIATGLWIAWGQPVWPGVAEAAPLFMLFMLVLPVFFSRLNAMNDSGTLRPSLIGLAGLASLLLPAAAGDSRMAGIGTSLMAVVCAWLVWNWPAPRFRFPVSALMPLAVAGFGLLAALTLYGQISRGVFVLLLPLVFADKLLDRWQIAPQAGGGFRDNGFGPLLVILSGGLWILLLCLLANLAAVPVDEIYQRQ